jgi:hypothetical protein
MSASVIIPVYSSALLNSAKHHCRYVVVSIVVPRTASEFIYRDIPDPKIGLPECNDSARSKKEGIFSLYRHQSRVIFTGTRSMASLTPDSFRSSAHR